MGANIPGKPREQLLYLAGVDVYAQEIRKALDDWEGFNVTHGKQPEPQQVQHKVDEKSEVEQHIEDVNLTQGVR